MLRQAVQVSPYPQDEASHALHAYDLIFPELIQHRGGWFRASRFDPANADNWFEHLKGDVEAVEAMVNHLDVFQDYPGKDGEYEVVEANALAEVLTFAWPVWAKQMYDVDIECRIYFEDIDDDEGPEAATVTFWSKKS